MLDRWAYVLAALFVAGCGAVGAVGGLIYGMVRKERA